MAYQLALAMGTLDVEGMLERMTSSQFSKWAAYFSVTGIGGARCALLQNSPYSAHLTPALPSGKAPMERVRVGEGRLGIEDWRRMRKPEREQKRKDLYDLVKTWAVLNG